MKEILVNSWAEFQSIIEKHNYREWLYRGQPDSTWKLESSLFRRLEKNIKLRSYAKKKKISLNREKYEEEIINKFKRSSHLYMSAVPEKQNIFDWLSMMQHYGAPTRILDFSFSPYVALFFALEEIKETATVYCIKFKDINIIDAKSYKNIEEKYKRMMETTKKLSDTILLPYEPEFTNGRLMAQQGAFLIPNSLNFSHNDILEYYDNDTFIYKILINEKCTVELIEKLSMMNISFSNLYPGLEGFCKSFETVGIIPINRLRKINK